MHVLMQLGKQGMGRALGGGMASSCNQLALRVDWVAIGRGKEGRENSHENQGSMNVQEQAPMVASEYWLSVSPIMMQLQEAACQLWQS